MANTQYTFHTFHLFTKEIELQERYPQVIVDEVLRIREMYNWFISNPDGTYHGFIALQKSFSK